MKLKHPKREVTFTMSAGHQFRDGFNHFLERLGQTIIVHNNWGQPNATSFEVCGLKNNEKGKPQNVMFQFKERVDIKVGSVLQLKQGNDLWRVVDTEDEIVNDTFIYFEAKVVKMSPDGKDVQTGSKSQAIFNAPVYGGVQVGGSQNVQNISIDSQSNVAELTAKLVDLIKQSSVPDLNKDDAIEALQRLPDLANKNQTEEVLTRVKTRLDIVKTAIDMGKDLAPIAPPLLLALSKLFGLG